jgi:CRISPR system Cascade subunit CasD
MADFLILRFDAPMMSFGGVLVDRHGVTLEFPAASMLTGLIANALGYEHKEFDRLDRLQARLRFAVRCDRAGEPLVDYHTVDLGQDFMLEGWTRWGAPESRAGGGAGEGTHIRLRHYVADAVYTIALALDPADEPPTLDDVARAIAAPERPLFLGRKCCLPAAPLVAGRIDAPSARDAAVKAGPLEGERGDRLAHLWWAEADGDSGKGERLFVSDRRDWANGIHVGRRVLRHEIVTLRGGRDGGR